MTKLMKSHDLSRVLLIANTLSANEVIELEAFINMLKHLNEHLKIDVLYWNENKKLTNNKAYQRKANEWIDKDFSFFGKLINPNVEKYLTAKDNLLIVFSDNFPRKVNKFINSNQADLKIGFIEGVLNFDVVLATKSRDLSAKIEMIKKYLID